MDHKLSTRTKVYAAYTDFSSDTANLDWDASHWVSSTTSKLE